MRMKVEIMHLGDDALLIEATQRVDGMMYPMGFTRIGIENAANLRTLLYDIHDLRSGIRPEYVASKIVELNDNPTKYRVECKLTADRA